MSTVQKKNRNAFFFGFIAGIAAISGCASHPMRPSSSDTTIITGQWKGSLAVPEQFSSNRGMLDPNCDSDSSGAGNISLRISQVGQDVEVEGHLRCTLQGKPVYAVELSTMHLELRGKELYLNGAKVGTATPVYFSMNTGSGKLTLIKYPTWEKVFYESDSPQADTPVTVSGVFEDRENFADDTPPVSLREPANAQKAD